MARLRHAVVVLLLVLTAVGCGRVVVPAASPLHGASAQIPGESSAQPQRTIAREPSVLTQPALVPESTVVPKPTQPPPTPAPDRSAESRTAVRLHGSPNRAKPAPSSLVAAAPRPSGRAVPGSAATGTAAGKAPATGPAAAGPTHRVATRVRVPALGIDLPVMRQPGSYPACNVAMYLRDLKQPGQGGPTYLYAHARTGMFLPLLTRSQVNNGAGMIGMTVEVYTGDNRKFVYRINEVRRHALDLRAIFARGSESLWLQTSEGPKGTVPKLQVGASLVSSGTASHAVAHPVPRPVACG